MEGFCLCPTQYPPTLVSFRRVCYQRQDNEPPRQQGSRTQSLVAMLRHLSGCIFTFDLLLLHEPSTASVCLPVSLKLQEPWESNVFINLLLESKARVKSQFCRSGSFKAAQNPSVHTEQLQQGSNLSSVTMKGEDENEGQQGSRHRCSLLPPPGRTQTPSR